MLYLALLRAVEESDEARGSSGPLPLGVKRAVDYIHAHAGDDITVANVVRAAEIPGRSLYRQFEQFVGAAPAQYLRNHRIDLARDALSSLTGNGITVQTVALDFGFGNLGRFARAYRARHGELPSATLARSRGHLTG